MRLLGRDGIGAGEHSHRNTDCSQESFAAMTAAYVRAFGEHVDHANLFFLLLTLMSIAFLSLLFEGLNLPLND